MAFCDLGRDVTEDVSETVCGTDKPEKGAKRLRRTQERKDIATTPPHLSSPSREYSARCTKTRQG